MHTVNNHMHNTTHITTQLTQTSWRLGLLVDRSPGCCFATGISVELADALVGILTHQRNCIVHHSERVIIRLETLIELKFLNSSFSSLSSSGNLTNSSLSSNSRQQYLSQQYPPPPLNHADRFPSVVTISSRCLVGTFWGPC